MFKFQPAHSEIFVSQKKIVQKPHSQQYVEIWIGYVGIFVSKNKPKFEKFHSEIFVSKRKTRANHCLLNLERPMVEFLCRKNIAQTVVCKPQYVKRSNQTITKLLFRKKNRANHNA